MSRGVGEARARVVRGERRTRADEELSVHEDALGGQAQGIGVEEAREFRSWWAA